MTSSLYSEEIALPLISKLQWNAQVYWQCKNIVCIFQLLDEYTFVPIPVFKVAKYYHESLELHLISHNIVTREIFCHQEFVKRLPKIEFSGVRNTNISCRVSAIIQGVLIKRKPGQTCPFLWNLTGIWIILGIIC